MRNATILLAVVAVLALGAPAYGSWIGGNGPVGNENDWHTAANWSEGYVPNLIGHTAIISNGGTAVISDNVGGLGIVYLGYGGATGGHILLVDGGVFGQNNNHPWLTISYAVSLTGPPSSFTQTGGTNNSSRIEVGDTRDAYGGPSLYEISGGTILGGNARFTVEPEGTFKVVGANASITLRGPYTQDPGSKLELVLNSAGAISPITLSGSGSATLAGTLSVDDAAWTTKSIGHMVTVITGGPVSGSFTLDPVNAANWSMTTTSTSVTLTSLVPEPATMVLLGLGGLGVLIRRRRK